MEKPVNKKRGLIFVVNTFPPMEPFRGYALASSPYMVLIYSLCYKDLLNSIVTLGGFRREKSKKLNCLIAGN